jgi:hypothetical protein
MTLLRQAQNTRKLLTEVLSKYIGTSVRLFLIATREDKSENQLHLQLNVDKRAESEIHLSNVY